jgi:uncharacterized membrane protein YeaQ/YmgE (transglycosylase-associated protein family)
MRNHGAPWQGADINPYIWCAVGAVLGLVAGSFMGSTARVVRIEDVLVGMFGAFIGGEFVTAMFNGGKAVETFTAGGLLNAVVSAAALLALLGLMRRKVGPMRPHKKVTRTR